MNQLQTQRCWAVCRSDGQGKLEYLSAADGAAVGAQDSDRLTNAAKAASYMHWLAGAQWPPYALALSLHASECIAIDLYDAWDYLRCEPVDGAKMWMQLCASYAELCWENAGARAIRIIARGTVPEGAVMPPQVKITASQFITLTTLRIPSRSAWQGADDGGVINDCTAALTELLVPHAPNYVTI